MRENAVTIKVHYPGYWLHGRKVKARLSRLAGPHGHALGEVFIVETKYGKFAIPVGKTQVLILPK